MSLTGLHVLDRSLRSAARAALLALTCATPTLAQAQDPADPAAAQDSEQAADPGTGASERSERRALEKPANTEVRPWHAERFLSVKLRDDLPIRARNGRLDDARTGLLAPAGAVLAGLGDSEWRPLSRLPDARLAELRAAAADVHQRAIADPASFFRVRLAAGIDVATACDLLNTLDIVEIAAPMQRPVQLPSSGPPVPPDWEADQGYLDPAPDGIDARAAWVGARTRGAGVRVLDLEYQFNTGHLDLPAITYHNHADTPTSGEFHFMGAHGNHGTAVLGVMLARDDDAGVVGIAADAVGHFIGTITLQPGGGMLHDIAAALFDAIEVTEPGDVILIEQQVAGPNYPGGDTQLGLVPSEWLFDVYTAIQAATGNGRVVVQAAGNGSQDLDAVEYRTGNNGHWPFLPENDSGAILVGAGAAPAAFGGTQPARARLAFSNYGSRLNVQGWGERVRTTGFGSLNWGGQSLGANGWYTANFGGTSSATPIVSGAAALVQANHRRLHGGAAMDPFALRTLLRDTGTPQGGTNPSAERIGPLPDLFRALFGNGLWVDFAASGPGQNGTFNAPYATLAQAVSVAAPGAHVWLKGGASPTAITMASALTLGAYGGPVTIGATGP
ncbi:MAG: S8 family serine peptidase [Planctomycetes bacterium]|nr:S8 family serine peptidase [Planctomycetota bacterium]